MASMSLSASKLLPDFSVVLVGVADSASALVLANECLKACKGVKAERQRASKDGHLIRAWT